MTSLRHQRKIKEIKADTHRLTRRERVRLGLAAKPVRRDIADVPFPEKPGRYDWYVLFVRPQRERIAAQRFFQSGIAAFCPVALVEARSSRRHHHKRHFIKRPVLPSAVMAGFAAGSDVPWLTVLDREVFPDVLGVLRFGVGPSKLGSEQVLALKQLDGMNDRTRHYTALVGDAVRIVEASFEAKFGCDKIGRVVGVSGGRADVEIEAPHGLFEGMFGGSVHVAGSKLVMTFDELDLEGV